MSAGKVSMSDLVITKRVDKSSPQLLKLCVTGKTVDEATVYCSKLTGGKTPEDYLTIKLNEVYVSSHDVGGAWGEDVGKETFTLAYAKIHYDYREQKSDGTLTSAGTVEYDLRKREQTA
jgi:type VI secretion system secreted protein Hcp